MVRSKWVIGLIAIGSALSGITAAEDAQRYRVNAIGVGMNLALPARKVTLSLKYFDEFSNQWTYQGYSLQISAAVVF